MFFVILSGVARGLLEGLDSLSQHLVHPLQVLLMLGADLVQSLLVLGLNLPDPF